MDFNMILIDANVVLDLILARRNLDNLKKILDFNKPLIDNKPQLTPTTLHIIFYYCQKNKVNYAAVTKLLSNFEILEFTQKTYELAIELADGNDVEDSLQIATAIDNNCQTFVTGDKNLIKKYQDKVKLKFTLV